MSAPFEMADLVVLIERQPDGSKTVCLMGEEKWSRLMTFSGPTATEDSWAFAARLCQPLGVKIHSDFGLGAERYAHIGSRYVDERPDAIAATEQQA